MSKPRFRRASAETRTLDDTLTPLEIARELQSGSQLPFAIVPLLAERPPVSYLRHELGEGAHFYTANCGAAGLIVAFCGASFRLMTSISYFLQMMPDHLFDVLILADPQKRYFDSGVHGYSSSLLETLERIGAFAAGKGYRRVITYGTSMGGFVALRAGVWLGADRAVSVGGAFTTHPPRLLRSWDEVRAFDLLCACRRRDDVAIVTAFAAHNPIDVEQQAALSAVLPNCVVLQVNTRRHNVIHYLDRNGQLGAFYAMIFGEAAVSSATFNRPGKSKAVPVPQPSPSIWQRLLGACRAVYPR